MKFQNESESLISHLQVSSVCITPCVDACAALTWLLWVFWHLSFAFHAFAAIVGPSVGVLTELDFVFVFKPAFLVVHTEHLSWPGSHGVRIAILASLIAILVSARCESNIWEATTLTLGVFWAAIIDATNLASL